MSIVITVFAITFLQYSSLIWRKSNKVKSTPINTYFLFSNHLVTSYLAILLVTFIGFIPNNAQALDQLGNTVAIAKSGLILNRVTNTFDGTVTLTNISSDTIAAPLILTIKDITSPGVAVYNSYGTDADGNSLVQAYIPGGVISPGGKAVIPIKFINSTQSTFGYSVVVSGTFMNANNSAQVEVHVYSYSGNETSPLGASAGSGVNIKVNGVTFAVTDAFGIANIQVPLNTVEIAAQRPSIEAGSTAIELINGGVNHVDIVLSDDAEIYGEAKLQIDQVKQLLLSNSFTSLTLRFLNASEKIRQLKELAYIELFDSIGNSLGDITNLFKLNADGSISPSKFTDVKTLLISKAGKLTLKVTGVDNQGISYENDASFYITSNKVSGTLKPSPSFPALDVSNIQVVGKILNTDIVVSTLSDVNGHFDFPNLPNGNLEITSQTLQNGSFFYGNGVFSLTGTANLNVPMLSANDLTGNLSNPTVQKSAVVQQTTNTTSTSIIVGFNARRPEDLAKGNTLQLKQSLNTLPFAAGSSSVVSATVNVVAGTQNIPSTKENTLTVPKGTKNVTLTYNVATAEYPYYVTQQSIYNDVWNITVLAGSQGAQLFAITRQINSQLTQQPIWLSNGTTGGIKQVFDVTTLAKDNDIALTLSAYATNIGDSIFPTSVKATVTLGAGLKINKVMPKQDSWTANNDKTYYSVPASGNTNTFHRYFDLDISKPDGSTIDKVKVELLGAGSDALIVDEEPGTNIQLINDKTIRVLATFKANASSINSVPPPSNSIQYRFTVTAKDADGNLLSDNKIESGKHPLWRMPTGFPRYSTRDTGLDDWCTKGTYNWMIANQSQLEAINDISGEHGKDIGHHTHAKGSDIDMYHFYLFPGADSNNGLSNYNMLVARINDLPKLNSTVPVVLAVGQTAKAQIISWITVSRAGIDSLAALPSVSQVIYASNAGGPNITALLRTGKVTVNGKEFDLGTGTWINAKHLAIPPHHHHVHITLNPSVIN